jgi:methylated-DNA-[protein]-cysteine S-methyltransferase
VQQPGAVFMQASWNALRDVMAGTTVSYAQLAAMAGRPAAVRAAGTACATNLVAPFVPCHRVIRSDGSLGNYGFGVTLKRTLLGHEGALEQGKVSGRE